MAGVALFCLATAAGEKTEPADPSAKGDLNRATTKQLIDQLASVSDYGIGFHPTAWASGFIAGNEQPSFGGGILGSRKPSVHPAMREVVRRGVKALPDLFAHLSDKRKTNLSISAHGLSADATWHSDEYHSRFRDEKRLPKGVNTGKQEVLKNSYALRVGDLCYVAIGQIVNRRLNAVRYQPSGCYVINSPVATPKLAEVVKREWAGLTATKHRKSLTADALDTTPYADWDAWQRIRFYYPKMAEEVALKLLARPLYDNGKLWVFLEGQLVKEQDESEWKSLIDGYVERNGAAVAEVLPLWLYWIYFRTASAKTPDFLAGRATAEKILAKLYPDYTRFEPAFLNAAQADDHATAVKALASYPSEKIDKAVFQVFQAATEFQFEERDRFYSKQLVAVCLNRLSDTVYGDACRSYCGRRLKDEESAKVRDRKELAFWRKLLGLDPLDVPFTEVERNAMEALQSLGAYMDEFGEELYFGGDTTTDDQVEHVKALKRLVVLHLAESSLTDAGMRNLEPLVNLKKLYLARTRITGDGLRHVKHLPQLQKLELQHTSVADEGLAHLAGFTNLKHLDLEGCDISDIGLAHLAGLTNMESLNLSEAEVTDAGLAHLVGLVNLESLDLSGTRITDAGLAQLKGLTRIETLNLRGCRKITDRGLQHLHQLTKLIDLYLGANQASPQGVASLQRAIPRVTVDYDWEFTLHEVDGQATFETDWLIAVFEGASLSSSITGTGSISVCSGGSGGSSRNGADRFSSTYSGGVTSIEFSSSAGLTYKFSLKNSGTTLTVGQRTFEIGNRKRTIIIPPDDPK